MANPTDVTVRGESRPNGELNALVTEFNEFVVSYRALLAKLDANHGAASDHVATLGDTGPSKVLTIFG